MKRFFFISFFLCSCLAFSSHAQDEQLLHKTYAQRVKPLLSFYDSLKLGDSVSLFNRVNSIKKLAVENNDDDLLMEAKFLRIHYFYYKEKFPASLFLSMTDTLMNEAVKRNKPWLIARIENMIALYDFYIINQYELAFEHFQKLYDVLVKFTSDEFPLKQTCLYQIAFAYYQFADYGKAIFYLQKALMEKTSFEGFRNLWVNIFNTLGVCYQELHVLDSSDHYFNLTYRKAFAENNRVWQAISSGNLGYNYFLRKQYDNAIPLLKKDVDIAIENEYWGLAAFALSPLASISLERNNISEAEEQLQQAKRYSFVSGEYKRLQTLYPLLSKLYAIKGNPALAAMFLDSALYVKDSLARKFNAMQILRAQQKLELEQQKAEIEHITSQKKIEILKRNILIALVVLMMSLSVYIFRQQQKKQQLNKEKLQKAENDLRLATKQLDDFTKYISEKNNLIAYLEQKIGDNEVEAMKQLQHSTILTDEEWEYFRQLFEKVHGGYLQRLKEKLPGLTPAETRFMALSKLKFSNKEMAATLGVSPQAIRVVWHRLRKKLDLPEESSINELIDFL